MRSGVGLALIVKRGFEPPIIVCLNRAAQFSSSSAPSHDGSADTDTKAEPRTLANSQNSIQFRGNCVLDQLGQKLTFKSTYVS